MSSTEICVASFHGAGKQGDWDSRGSVTLEKCTLASTSFRVDTSAVATVSTAGD